MIIIEKNSGKKIPYEVDGTKITFDDDLTINLAKREEDWPVGIDVCYDMNGALCIGAAAGRSYVAQIDIPARKYAQVTPEAKSAPTVNFYEEENGATYLGSEMSQSVSEPLPLDMDSVRLSLWSIE